MTMDEMIKKKIEESFHPLVFELVNESKQHKGHAGDDGSGETHYNLLVVSERFEGVSRIERQRLVYQILAEPMRCGIHALSLRCLSKQEYAAL